MRIPAHFCKRFFMPAAALPRTYAAAIRPSYAPKPPRVCANTALHAHCIILSVKTIPFGSTKSSRGSVSFRRMSVVFLAFFGKRGVASLGGGWGELL